ncbi:DNA methylase [Rivularia sp. PCC 7116]|uniref:helicase-related protein n=1 Tax=Rivularia sp. PCC 7116 TaxID=373994 RepID=UPI00029EC744|nr:helicase-related protein [Rivularia sp. PCC 7116]AFY57331.1 DNA methylase [Rivularia sp. PCC 7116]
MTQAYQLSLFEQTINYQNTQTTLPKNFRLTHTIGKGGIKTKAAKNIEAIKLSKKLDQENRYPTPTEQQILAEYLGWGIAPEIFEEPLKPSWEHLGNQLKALLTPTEYQAARKSIINAYYTTPEIIQEIYQGLKHLGFSGSRILEPSMGCGLFLGLAPTPWNRRAKWTGIELDSITGRIAQQLYPEADIYIKGFEDVMLPRNYFDLAIGNVPFSNITPNDPKYNKLPIYNLHDYFFIKSLDLIRPGGLIAFITSVGTLQSRRSRGVRELLAKSADLVGAMRLPSNAFMAFTNTQVTTDLIILQKRQPEQEPSSTQWLEVCDSGLTSSDGSPLLMPCYYKNNPEMLLGKLTVDKLYGGANRLGLASDGRDLISAIRTAFTRLPEGIYLETEDAKPKNKITRKSKSILIPPDLQNKIKPFSLIWYENHPWQVMEGKLERINVIGIPRLRLFWLIRLREVVKEVFFIQSCGGTDKQLSQAQKRLNHAYDSFIRSYGYLHSVGNRRVFSSDPEYPLLLALENYDPDSKTASKTDIFSKRTIREYEPKTSADTALDALIYSLSEKGRIDIDFMTKLLSQPPQDIICELQKDKLIHFDPKLERWVTSDEYLSGNVRNKLEIAQSAVKTNPELKVNVEALEKVQPTPLLPGDIYVRLGSPWIPTQDITDFIAETLNVDADDIYVYHSKATATWEVQICKNLLQSQNNCQIYGTERIMAHQLIELALNLRVPIVRDKVDESYVENPEATRIAQTKQENLKELFKRWIWSDFQRAERLTQTYNQQYNSLVPRHFDGSHLELPGMNPQWRNKLRSHQLNAIWRIISSGNTLLGHAVGAGKTSESIAASQELKRLGICYKPCLVVMDHLPEQMASEAIQMYPQMRLLIAGSAEMEAKKRRELASRIATGDWDLIILSHTAFSKLPLHPDTIKQFLEEESKMVETDYLAAKSNGRRTKRVMKNLEKKLTRLSENINAVANAETKDNTVFFDELGIDWIFYDESQQVKNLDLNTKINRVLGVPSSASYRAKDFLMKTRYMSYKHGAGRGVALMTATPITNTLAEAWVNQIYLQYETLQQLGLLHFDAWVSNFAEIKVGAEITPQGTLEVKSRLAVFNNIPEWRQLFWQVADILTDEDLNLPKPEKEYVTQEVPATEEQLKFFDYVAQRAEAIKAREVESTEDNMPRITTHIRQGVVDLRCLSQDVLCEFLEPEEIDALSHFPTKVDIAIDNIFRIWEATQAERLTQLVFCDVGTPKENNSDRFTVYSYIKSQLIERGVPTEEIAFIHDAKTDEQKSALFRAVRQRKIRVFIGSTAKMGVGTNVQDYVIAAHDLDCPWRPTDHTQRAGRSVRQGNYNSKVKIYRYVTQGKPYQDAEGKKVAGLSPDGYLYQTSKTKAEFIEAALAGRNTARSIDDCTDIVLSYAEVMATASGDPRLMRKVELDSEVAKLLQEERDHINQQITIHRDLEKLPDRIEKISIKLQNHKADSNRTVSVAGDRFSINFYTNDGKKVRVIKRKAAGEHINAIVRDLEIKVEYGTFSLGQFAGFDLSIVHDIGGCTIQLIGNAIYKASVKKTPIGTISALEYCVNSGIDKELKQAENQLQKLKQAEKDLSLQKDQPFSKAAELQAVMKEQSALNKELGLIEEDFQVVDKA